MTFEFLEPRSLAEAITLLDTDDSSVRVLLGHRTRFGRRLGHRGIGQPFVDREFG
jgi:hypothetical protein